jgi:hypothetical protein
MFWWSQVVAVAAEQVLAPAVVLVAVLADIAR